MTTPAQGDEGSISASVSGGVGSPVVVSIDLHSIYNKLVSVESCVQKIHTTMEAQEHEKRLRSVEKRSWQMPTLTGLVAIAALVVSILSVANGGG